MTDDQEAEVAAEDESEDDTTEEAAAESTAETEETEDAETGIQDGDFVKLEYTARTVEEGQLVDTTSQEVAEEEGVDDQGQEFEPRTIVVGEGHIFGAVEDDLQGKDVGDSGSVTVPPAEAFGEYDRDEVRTISAEKIPEDDRYPGAQVQIDNQQGYVETIIGGRARVDFNHPLAGEEIEYDYEIVELVEDRVEKAKGLFAMYLDQDLEMWIETDEVEEEVTVEPDEDGETPEESQADGEAVDDDDDAELETETETVEKETLYIEATPQLSMNQQWMFSKQQIAMDVMGQLDLDRVIVQETIDGGGMGGMMGGMGGMMGGGGGMGDLEEQLEDADVDAEEIVDELDEAGEE